MAITHPSVERGTATSTTHSKDDALDRREFELLLEGCYRMDDEFYRLQCQFVVLVAGRLGLRAGEIAHMSEDWVDRRRDMICIPRHDPCTTGRDGTICGSCKQNAEQKVQHNDDLVLEDALAHSWSAKTDHAAREVPYDASPRAAIVVDRFFDRFDEWPQSVQAVNRRVKRAARYADGLSEGDVYPHCLRASSASHWAGKGLDVFALKSMMGWADLSTAKCYVTSSGERTAQAVRDTI